jgi:hypothetical protein
MSQLKSLLKTNAQAGSLQSIELSEEVYDEASALSTSSDASVEAYEEDCEQEEHDGYLLSMADAAFDGIVAEAISNAKETIIEGILDQSKLYAHQEAYDFTAVLCEGDGCDDTTTTTTTTTTTVSSTEASVVSVESGVESTVESVDSSVSSAVNSVEVTVTSAVEGDVSTVVSSSEAGVVSVESVVSVEG